MSKVPADLRYTKDHEWARKEGDVVRVGITDYAQEHLGDVVMVELPKVGLAISAHKVFGTVESPKSVSDLFAPISGSVTLYIPAEPQHSDDSCISLSASPGIAFSSLRGCALIRCAWARWQGSW